MGGLAGYNYRLQTPTDASISNQDGKPQVSDYEDLGNVTSNSIELTATEIDITSQSSNQNKELLDGFGIKSASISSSGLKSDQQLHNDLEENFGTQRLRWFRLIQRDSGRVYEGKFKITSLQVEGANDQAVTFSLSLMSSGEVTRA